MKVAFINNFKALPKGAGWSFTLANIWRCRFMGGGGSFGFTILNLGLEFRKDSPIGMGSYQSGRPNA